ncbi:FtsB family cell division protein [Candidatus Electronema sp. PJ]|uniref:FtsB family cell division protein n=1 Tax=Candidatus Electronema sp. PJ TaxID=3401572 RepID=UPI003AA9ADC8
MARLLPIVFILALLLLAFAPGRSLRSYMQVKQKTEVMRLDNERLQQETAQLREEIRLLKHDVKYLEKIAREKYGMLKKNEEVYYVDPIQPVEPSPESNDENNEPEGKIIP